MLLQPSAQIGPLLLRPLQSSCLDCSMASVSRSSPRFLAIRCLRIASPSRPFPSSLARGDAIASPKPASFIERRRDEPSVIRRYNHKGRHDYSIKRTINKNFEKGGSFKEPKARKVGEGDNDAAPDGERTWNEYAVFAVLSVPAAVGIWYLLESLGILDPYTGKSMVVEMEPNYGNLRETEPRYK